MVIFKNELEKMLITKHDSYIICLVASKRSKSPIQIHKASMCCAMLSHPVILFALCDPADCKHTRLSCPSLSSTVCSNSCPLSWWCHQTISSSVIPFSCLQSFPASVVFSNELAFCNRWPKYWSFSFSISRSSDYSGLIPFRMDWLDLLAV